MARIASSSNNQNNNHPERPHNNLTNIPTSPEIDDTLNPDNENPYTVRGERPERRELLRARRRSSLSFPTQDSTLVSYGSTDIESNIVRPLETGHSEPPSRTGTPTLHNFSISSPNEHSSVNTDHTPTPSELRANPFLPPTFSQRQDFNFVQEHFRVQPLHSPNCSLWSATSPQSASTSTTPLRTNQTSSSNTSVSLPRIEIPNTLQPPRNTALSPSSFIPDIRLPSSHPGRIRSTPILNCNPQLKVEQMNIYISSH